MPNANFAIGNTYEAITRPVAYGVAKDCLKALGFPEQANIDFTGHIETSLQKDSSLTPIGNKNFFGTNVEATLKIQEDPIRERILEASMLRQDIRPVFMDPTVHTYVRPAYSPTRVTLSFSLRFTDEVQAMRWRDDLIARSHLLRHEMVHKITYHYQIPDVFLVVLDEIFKLKEKVDQTGMSFGQWLKAHFDPRATALSNMAGGGVTLVMPEEQVRVLGWFEFQGVTDGPVYNKDKSTWSVEFDYTYIYDKAIEAVLTYPLVVRQQMLGTDYRPTQGVYTLDRENVAANNVVNKLGQFFDTFTPPKGIYQFRYPEFDTWHPEEGVPGCKMLWIGLITISEQDRRSVLDLNGLGPHRLSEASRAFLKADRQYVVDPNRSLFEIGVYSNNSRALAGQVVMDENLNVSTTGDISLEPVYHVVISVRTDLLSLPRADADRLRDMADLVYAVLIELYPEAYDRGLIPAPNKHGEWTRDQWRYVAELVTPPRAGLTRPWILDPNGKRLPIAQVRRAARTVGTYNLIVRRA